MRMLRVAALLVLLTATRFAVSMPLDDPALTALLQTAPTAAEYPHDGAIYLLKEMEITIQPSGAFTVHERKLLTLLSTQGLAAAQWEIPYDRASERLTVLTARTLLQDQAYPLNETLTVDSAVYPGMAWYDTMQVRRFPLPAATVGATLEVETAHDYLTPRIPGAFATRLPLYQRYPVREARYTIRTPLDHPLTIRGTGAHPPSVREQVEDGQRVYRWTCRDLPALQYDEPQMPPGEEIAPSMRITSLPSWAPVVQHFRDLTAGKDTVTDALRQVATARTAGCTTPEEKVTALFAAVRTIPYVAVELGEMSDIPPAADEVARVNYGDCKAKAVLLHALLTAVGIPADYVLVRTTNRGRLDPEQYGLDEFNHLILVAHLPTREWYLDATLADTPATQLPPLTDGADGLIVAGQGTRVTLPTTTAADNATQIRLAVSVQTDGSATGEVMLTYTGCNAMLQRGMLTSVPTDRYRQALEGYLAPRLGPEVTLTEVTVDGLREPERPLTLTARFTTPVFLQPAGESWTGYLPAFAYQPNRFRGMDARRFPYYQAIAGILHLETTITLPDSYTITQTPAPLTVTSPLGDYRDSVSVQAHTLVYRCDLSITRGVFPAERLEEIRRWSAVLALDGRNQLQFVLRRR